MKPTTSFADELVMMPWALRSRAAVGEIPQQMYDRVYRSTVRGILDWFNADAYVAPVLDDFADLEDNVFIERDDAGLRRTALAYFRTCLEEYRIHPEEWNSFQPKTPVLRVSVDGYSTYAAPHLERKAFLVGMYAMTSRQQNGFRRSQLAELHLVRSVPTVILPEPRLSPYLSPTFREGAVFAPAADGLPVAELYRGRRI
jgi:hypothetical protein